MSDPGDLIKAVEVSAKLRDGFNSVADCVGADRAFGYFAGKVCQEGYEPETEERFVRLIRAAYDAYVETA